MSHTAEAAFTLDTWDENAVIEQEDGTKLTRVRVEKTFTGDLEGESHLEYTMYYRPDGSAFFVGLERFTGTLHGNEGSFVLHHTGGRGGGVEDIWTVVEGSGTGDLTGLSGQGTMLTEEHAERYEVQFKYALEG